MVHISKISSIYAGIKEVQSDETDGFYNLTFHNLSMPFVHCKISH